MLDNFQDYFDLYKKSTIKGKELIKINNEAENAIDTMENKSLMNYLKSKLLSKKNKHKPS